MLGEIPGAFVTEDEFPNKSFWINVIGQHAFFLSVRHHHTYLKPHLNLQTFPSRTVILGCTLCLI